MRGELNMRHVGDDELAVSHLKSIKPLRLSKHLSQDAFGAQIGISGSLVSYIERFPHNVTVNVYQRVAVAMGWEPYSSGRKISPIRQTQRELTLGFEEDHQQLNFSELKKTVDKVILAAVALKELIQEACNAGSR